MIRNCVLAILCTIAIGGCTPLRRPSVRDVAAELRMRVADSLATVSLFQEAVGEYAQVAQEFPNSPFYKTAVLKAAYLSSHPRNSTASDSASLTWFGLYLALPISGDEKNRIEMEISLLNRLIGLKNMVARQKVQFDSLRFVLKERSLELQTRSGQLRDLEAQLKQANEELSKLRDVDINISNHRIKK